MRLNSINEKLVSVIIPTNNHGIFLERSINSIKRQDYDNLEIIIINDGSTDDTADIIKNMKEKYGKMILSKNFNENKGAEFARQLGLTMAKGEYICFIDSDDEWLKNKLHLQVNALEKDFNYDAVSSWYLKNNNNKDIPVRYPSPLEVNDILWSNYLGNFSMCMFRSSLLKKGLNMTMNLQSCQDWDFWIKILSISSVGVIQKYLVRQYAHDYKRITKDPYRKAEGLTKFVQLHEKKMNKKQIKHHFGSVFYYKSIDKNNSRSIRFKYLSIYIYIYITLKRKLDNEVIYKIVKFFSMLLPFNLGNKFEKGLIIFYSYNKYTYTIQEKNLFSFIKRNSLIKSNKKHRILEVDSLYYV